MRALKILVVVMGLMLVVGFVGLVVVIMGRLNHRAPEPGAAATAAAPFIAPPIDMPNGAHVESMTAGEGRLVVDLVLAGGERQLVIIDLATGRRLGTIPLRAVP